MNHYVVLLPFLVGLHLAAADEDALRLPLNKAITAKIEPVSPLTQGLTGFLGVSLDPNSASALVVSAVADDSPASQAGIQPGDTVLKINGKTITSADKFRSELKSRGPGESVDLEIQRKSKKWVVAATLRATSSPMHVTSRVIIGLRMGEPGDEGIPITSVTKDLPGARAGLRVGDVLLAADGVELGDAHFLGDALSEKHVGEVVTLQVRRKTEKFETKVTLVAGPETAAVPPEERRELKTWKKPVFNVAVVPIEFADTKHNPASPLEAWKEAFFSTGTYNKTDVTGRTVFGSMNDYYQEVSCGKLAIKGKIFPWLTLSQKQANYGQLKAKAASAGGLLLEAVDKLLEREGAKALEGFDGIGFIYAGEKGKDVNRGNVFWPHRSTLRRKNGSWSYVIIPEMQVGKMTNISVMCHETGHSLGLPDLYARPENPGSEGAGRWCVMSNHANNGRPQHFSAWSKEQLGWLNPVVVDPTVKQKLVLGPVEGSTSECLKVLVRRDGSEYFLLENRRKQGFDASLPAEGLLIWRVVDNRPILEESHGITGPSGPRVFLRYVPYPSKANNSFTPYTTPASRSQLGGGLPVHINNIRQLPDGKIALDLGGEFE